MNRTAHMLMGASGGALTAAVAGQNSSAVVVAATIGFTVGWWPDVDHRSKGLWYTHRDWAHCVEPWLLLSGLIIWWLGWGAWPIVLGLLGGIGSHLFGDSFTKEGVPLSLILQAFLKKYRTFGAKAFPSGVRTRLSRRGYRQSVPATITAAIIIIVFTGVAVLVLRLTGST